MGAEGAESDVRQISFDIFNEHHHERSINRFLASTQHSNQPLPVKLD
jgi:hypothetical protein